MRRTLGLAAIAPLTIGQLPLTPGLTTLTVPGGPASLGDISPAEFEDLYVQPGDQLISPFMKIGPN